MKCEKAKNRKINTASGTAWLLAVFVCLFAFTSHAQSPRRSAREQRILQIQELMQQGDLPGARRLLTEAARLFPADAGFDNLRGIIEAQEKNYQAAEAAFKQAVRRLPKFTGAYLNLGRLYLENTATDADAVPKALQTYQHVLQYQPDNAEANYQCATLLMLRGEYQSSLAHLARLPADQQSAQTLAVLCANYAGLKARARADEAARLLLNQPDFSETDVTTILPVLTAAQRDDLTVRLFEGLVSRQLASIETLHHLGLLYERQGELERARAMLEKCAVPDRPLTGLLVDLARVAHRQRDYRGALGYLAHARDLEPQNAAIHYFFGMVCVDLNLGTEAHTALGQAVRLQPDNAQFNYAMGIVSSFRHDPAEAVPYLKKYLQLKPGDARGVLMLGVAWFKSKDYEAAHAQMKHALNYPETKAAAHYYLGSIARQQGRVEEALREQQQALQLNADYVDALAELGQCYLQQKNYELSETHLRRALVINPHHYTANFNLLMLYSRTKDARLAEQSRRVEELSKLREERAQDFLRGVEVRPYRLP